MLVSRKRRIICGQSILCEDVIGPDSSPFIDTFAKLHLFGEAGFNQTSYNLSLQLHFLDVLSAYTKRLLTHREDRLNGISGILEEMSKTSGRSTSWDLFHELKDALSVIIIHFSD